MTTYILCAVIAVIISGLAKGGFAGLDALSMPIMVLGVDPIRGAAILLPILMVQDAVSVWAFRHSGNRSIVVVMLPRMAVGVVLGYLFAASVSELHVLATVGTLSIVFGLHRLRYERTGAFAAADSPGWVGTQFGVGSGFASQIAHAGSPPFEIWVLPRRLPRDILVGTTAICFAALNWMKVPAFAALGQFTCTNLIASALLLPVALASTLAGVWILKRIDAMRFYRIIYVIMIALGVKLVWDAVA